MIGHRFRLFHQRTLEKQPQIPHLRSFPDFAEKLKDRKAQHQFQLARNGFSVWDEAGISAAEIHARNRAGWEQMFDVYEEGENVHFNVLKLSHHPNIEEALGWHALEARKSTRK
jgi:hypothetical protein